MFRVLQIRSIVSIRICPGWLTRVLTEFFDRPDNSANRVCVRSLSLNNLRKFNFIGIDNPFSCGQCINISIIRNAQVVNE